MLVVLKRQKVSIHLILLASLETRKSPDRSYFFCALPPSPVLSDALVQDVGKTAGPVDAPNFVTVTDRHFGDFVTDSCLNRYAQAQRICMASGML